MHRLGERARDVHNGVSKAASKALMARIRKTVGWVTVHGYAIEEPPTKRHCSYQWGQPRRIAMLIRGEWSRIGSCSQHDTTGAVEQFELNMQSLRTRLVSKVEDAAGHLEFVIYADIMGDSGRTTECKQTLHRVFGSQVKEARVSPFLRGCDQVNSFMSLWDALTALTAWLTVRKEWGVKLIDSVVGVFVARADIQYKKCNNEDFGFGLASWPLEDKMCFLWQINVWKEDSLEWFDFETAGVPKGAPGCNDTVFYVPQRLFQLLRRTLATELVKDTCNLHWIPLHPDLRKEVWREYKFQHRSNTEYYGSPVYTMPGRKQAADNCQSKFRQYWLEHCAFSKERENATALSSKERTEIWCQRVKAIVNHALTTHSKNSVQVNQFVEYWTKLYPDDIVAWYQPEEKLLKSMEVCWEVTRKPYSGNQAVYWAPVPREVMGEGNQPCKLCKFHELVGCSDGMVDSSQKTGIQTH